MRIYLMRALLACAALCPAPLLAQVEISYHGCTDAHGAPVATLLDPALDVVVASRVDAAAARIVYNPEVLPQLGEQVRMFFYAQTCARHNLGLPLLDTLSAEQAARADCAALESLLRSGLVQPAGVAALQAALQFSAAEWLVLPGPPRDFDLAACQRRIASRPSLSAPPAGQEAWNACVRVCGEVLRACRGSACAADYERCVARCNAD
ncbi:hypothetical protein [Pseudothauera lacus]|nr:hypothetical protein [Pseudothauera lacus]